MKVYLSIAVINIQSTIYTTRKDAKIVRVERY